MSNLDSILKSRDITFPTTIHLVKSMDFPVVMHEYVNWTRKKAECQRIDAFELWFWTRLLRVPWTAGRSKQSILKEISPGSSLDTTERLNWTELNWRDKHLFFCSQSVQFSVVSDSLRPLVVLGLPNIIYPDQIRSDQLLSHIQLFATPWIAVHQASLSITNTHSHPSSHRCG